jgi:hypothetical protein
VPVSALTLGIALCATCAACAASPPPPAASLDEAFAAIQVHEARIEHARARVQHADGACADVCAAVSEAEGSASELCAIAREARDADALTRCEAATRSGETLLAQVATRCGCAGRAP